MFSSSPSHVPSDRRVLFSCSPVGGSRVRRTIKVPARRVIVHVGRRRRVEECLRGGRGSTTTVGRGGGGGAARTGPRASDGRARSPCRADRRPGWPAATSSVKKSTRRGPDGQSKFKRPTSASIESSRSHPSDRPRPYRRKTHKRVPGEFTIKYVYSEIAINYLRTPPGALGSSGIL